MGLFDMEIPFVLLNLKATLDWIKFTGLYKIQYKLNLISNFIIYSF